MQFVKQDACVRVILLLTASSGMGFSGIAVAATQAVFTDRVGAVYEINKDVETASEGNGGETGNSTDRDTIVERVLGVRSDGLELEYDFPKNATEQDRESNWQFPIRIFKPFSGTPQLLNRSDLEARLERWLTKGGIPRTACGHWVFTWNAFKIDCDPQSALATVAAYDLRPNDLQDGSIYNDPEASGPITLRKATKNNVTTYSGATPIDPENVRREQVQSDMVVAEITKKQLTVDDAMRVRSNEKIAGSISVSFEVAPSGFVRKRTKIAELDITGVDGAVEHRTSTEILKRQAVSGEGGQR